jgi:MSHA biogenesis protein MshO
MRQRQRGFTLVEAVFVIVVTGIIAAIVAVFVRLPVQGYMDAKVRAELSDAADTTLRRMGRDIRLALPNSVRTTTIGGISYVEFLLTKTGGRYLAEEDSPSAGSILSFTDSAGVIFTVVGPMPAGAQAIVQNDFVVVYNLGPGQDPADAYNGSNIARVAGVDTVSNTITLQANPFASQATKMTSPGRRFNIVTTPVTYACDPAAGTLTRYWGYAIQQAQPDSVAAAPLSGAPGRALLATGVTGCTFSYDQVAGNLSNQRSGLIGLGLTLTAPASANSGAVTLFQQVHVDNTP